MNPTPIRRLGIPFVAALAAALPAQTLTVPTAVSGQPLALTATGVTPGAWLAWLASVAGPGQGPCSPAHGLCLDLLDPIALTITPSDPGGNAALLLSMPTTTVTFGLWFQGVEFATTVPLPKTNAAATTLEPLAFFDDEFAGTALAAQWTVLHPQLAAIQVGGGTLDIVPSAAQLPNMWFQHGEGPLVWRLVHGDFTATARLTVDDPASPGNPPPPGYRLAGLMARAPGSTAADQDYVHVALGSATAAQPIVAEDKSTTDSVSDWRAWPVAANSGEIRIVRSGRWFSLEYRVDAQQSWAVLRAHDRPDLPATLQVGLMAYSNTAPPQLRGRFDWIRFE
ncbi:MAG: DUF1349 domain-containing protein [Planctomycetes bacterium]|nr:DUF1349 domain-containing protein [Planctomycetota bacterium]